MITSINEFNEYINEVRLPHGYFKVVNTFNLPDKGWDVIFNRDAIIEIDTNTKTVKKWNQLFNNASGSSKSGKWKYKTYSYLDLMQPELYKLFKSNTVKLSAEDTPEFAPDKSETVRFTTTVGKFNRKAQNLGLDDNDKIEVTIL